MLKRRTAIAVLLLLSQIPGLWLMASSVQPHWVATALYKVLETDDSGEFNWHPVHPPSWYAWDPPEAFAAFRPEAEAAVAAISDEWKRYLRLASLTRALGSEEESPHPQVSSLNPSEIRAQLQQGMRGNCAHYAILLMAYLRSLGRPARMLGLSGYDGIGGYGHAVVEVWVESAGKWAALDVQNHAAFLLGGTPLSLLEIRQLLYADRESEIEVVQGSPFRIQKSQLIDDYRLYIKDIEIDGRGDLISRSKRRYGPLQRLRPLLKRSPHRLRQLAANLFGSHDVRVHYLDRHATPYYAQSFSCFLRGALLLWAGPWIAFLFWLSPSIRRKRGAA